MRTGDRQRYWAALGGLALLYVGLVWSLPVLPCQDLPQHLAYARIFMDYDRADLRFRDMYALPAHFEPYFTVYLALAWLGARLGLEAALRLLLSVFVVLTFLSTHYLVSACYRDGTRRLAEPMWPSLLAGLLVFSPSTSLGFLSFVLCLPLFLFGCGALVGWLGEHPRPSDRIVALASGIAMSSIHVVAAGMFAAVAMLHFFGNRKWDQWIRLLAIVTTSAAVFSLWNRFGNVGVGRPPSFDFGESANRAFGLEIVNMLFRVTWSDPPATLTYLLWTVLGPFRLHVLPWVAVALGGMLFFAFRQSGETRFRVVHAARRTVVAFAVCSLLVPWGLFVPSEITFVNLRMMTLALGLALSLVPPNWFGTVKAQAALVSFCLLHFAHSAYRGFGFAAEARAALDLVAKVPPNAILMSLPYHNRTAHFGKLFRLSHFLPMYYSVRHGGINTQFWAKYTDHLPIAYKPGARPDHTPDWLPETFEPAHLRASDFLLVQSADAEDPRDVQQASAAAKRVLDQEAVLLECRGLWCLYRLNTPSTPNTTDHAPTNP